MIEGIKLWVDDKRPAPQGWIWVKTSDEAKGFIQVNHKDITYMSLDHDLAGDYWTGYDLLKWIAQNGYMPTQRMNIHTMNPVGRQNMIGLLTGLLQRDMMPRISISWTCGQECESLVEKGGEDELAHG